MESFSAVNRQQYLEQMSHADLDVLIIGGGITGAGILLDAVSRGLRAGLVDMQDFAAGTSSRSTKLIHGGLRYLKQLEFRLVAEVGKERAIVARNAPHITKPEPMILPIYKQGSLGYTSASIALAVYDFLAGVKKSERRKMLSKEEVLKLEPGLKSQGLKGGAYYYEYRTDDARLTIEILKKATELGAIACNYAKVEDILKTERVVSGVRVREVTNNSYYNIPARYVVNATGPWVDAIDKLDDALSEEKLVHTKGVHIVLDRARLPIKHSLYFDTPDGRMVFAIPRQGKVYAGTTDTFYSGNLENPMANKVDRDYILNSLNQIFPDAKLTFEDVESWWAGLRPLIKQKGKSASGISRKDELFETSSGLITIAGGKLTGYRKMAQRVVDLIVKKIRAVKTTGPCITDQIRLSGAVGEDVNYDEFYKNKLEEFQSIGLSEAASSQLLDRYGSNVDKIISIWKEGDQSEASLDKAQWIYCIENEMTLYPDDFLTRRTGETYFNIEKALKYRDTITNFYSKYFHWDDELEQNVVAQTHNKINQVTSIK
ncbi:MAG TPA: glycerol-3-phosphate dehydrogenase/oxidase [Cytophagaceae bacterium]